MLLVKTEDTDRKLVVLQGSQSDSYNVINTLKKKLLGDWVLLSMNTPRQGSLTTYVRSLLGREFVHAIFDATDGFNLDAFLILIGTLKKGSLLVLMLPEDLLNHPDLDTVRWNEQPTPIATPNFMLHLQAVLVKQLVTIYKSHEITEPMAILTNSHYCYTMHKTKKIANLVPTKEQNKILIKLKKTVDSIVIVTAKRGRGKSALAGFFSRSVNSWICAPNKECTTILRAFCRSSICFFSPDNLITTLISGTSPPSWIIIDEAAMISLPILRKIIAITHTTAQLLLLTTTEGYEGTEQQFLINLLPETGACHLHLNQPIRWSKNDSLERIASRLMLEENKIRSPLTETDLACDCYRLMPCQLLKNNTKFEDFYALLRSAHYRTTPTDLRRILDATNIGLMALEQQGKILGALVTIKEGGLSRSLNEAIWLGSRWLKGHLVAQMLTSEGGDIMASSLRSLRINRIAIDQRKRRRGLGKMMIAKLIAKAKKQHFDFISVSFSYQSGLLSFWLSCSFELVHISADNKIGSKNYTVIVIKPLTASAEALKKRLRARLNRNQNCLRYDINATFLASLEEEKELNDCDVQELTGFAYAMKSYKSVYGALFRLRTSEAKQNAPLLHMLTYQAEAIKRYKLSGRRAFITALRGEVRHILMEKGIHSVIIPNLSN